MKRLLLFIIICFCIFFPAAGKDKCNIFLSPLGGYSMLRGDYIISYFDDEGRLDVSAVERIAGFIGRYANNAREFPFWIDSEDAWRKLRPFTMIPIKNSNDFYIHMLLSYEWNWTEIARIYNHHGVKLWVSLFDHCGLRNNKWNPWTIAYPDRAFYSERAKLARHQFIDTMIGAFKGKVVGYELVNEPRLPLCTPEFLADTFVYLIKKGVPPEDIILGIQYDMKEKDSRYSELYRKFRKLVTKELGKEWAQWLKSRCISPCHNMNMDNLKKMLGPNPPKKGSRNIKISFDGWRDPRPTKPEAKEVTRYFFEAKWKAAWNNQLSVEVIYGKKASDPPDTIIGVIEAYREFYGEYPENYRRYQEKIKILEVIWNQIFWIYWR